VKTSAMPAANKNVDTSPDTARARATSELSMRMLLASFLVFAAVPLMGQGTEAAKCWNLRKHGDAGASACFQKLTAMPDAAVQAEGYWGQRNYQAANDAFRAAVKARDKDPKPRIRWGLMFLEHWQPADAADLFGEALAIDKENADALLGLARVASESFEAKAIEYAEKALKSNPKLFEAHELIARVALEDNNPEKARTEATMAVQMSPEALDGMVILATIDWLDDKTSTWMDQVMKINPKYGEAYATVGHFFVINRRYREGIEYYRKAIATDPQLWSARSQLGIELMRFGKNDEARQNLEAAFDAGYKDPATTNTLRLMDSYKNYETFTTPTTVLKLQKKEAALLRPYFQAELDRAMAVYEKKYKFKLKEPVQIEVYPAHEDFAVRTMGMPGLGALGVTFGYVVAMDSPSGRKPGEFHWASTMWHELSHVYVLAMTDHRVPRWFTEGMAVYEETATQSDWGDRLDHESIKAIKDKKLLPIAELDRGFIHPSYPSQVVVSYFQGGKICNFIAEKWGYDTLLAMIHDYADKLTTTEVVEKELKVKPEEFDKQFIGWLEAQTKRQVEGFDEWSKRLRALAQNAKTKDWATVIKEGVEIRDIYPDYVELGNVYDFLAQAYIAQGDKAKAMAELAKYSKVGGRDPATLKELATLESDAGMKKEAVSTLERLNVIYLEDEQAHQKLGDLYMELGVPALATREYGAVLALGTVDKAGAHFQLAKALVQSKKYDDARDEVLSSLEAAPGFKPAQKLLLELNSK
jgi:tetratricopeptide (TPR) repeat protein